MAHLIVYNNNSVICISESVEQYKLQIPNYGLFENEQIGKIVSISDSNFNLIQTDQKMVSYDGTNVILDDSPIFDRSQNDMDNQKQFLLDRIENILPKHKDNNFGTEINAFKQLLINFDTSTISYPYSGSLIKYLKEQNNPVISHLQLF